MNGLIKIGALAVGTFIAIAYVKSRPSPPSQQAIQLSADRVEGLPTDKYNFIVQAAPQKVTSVDVLTDGIKRTTLTTDSNGIAEFFIDDFSVGTHDVQVQITNTVIITDPLIIIVSSTSNACPIGYHSELVQINTTTTEMMCYPDVPALDLQTLGGTIEKPPVGIYGLPTSGSVGSTDFDIYAEIRIPATIDHPEYDGITWSFRVTERDTGVEVVREDAPTTIAMRTNESNFYHRTYRVNSLKPSTRYNVFLTILSLDGTRRYSETERRSLTTTG